MSNTHAGKVAIVTGSARGIGAAIASQLASESAKVVVNYNTAKAAAEDIVAAILRDGGKALAVQADEKDALAAIEPLLIGLGADQTSSDTDFLFRSDHAGFNVLGVPTLMLWNSMDRYETLMHQASDTFDSVVRSDLDQTVAVTGSTAYAIADAPHPFAAHLSHAEVADMFRKCNAVADFNSAKVIGWVPSN